MKLPASSPMEEEAIAAAEPPRPGRTRIVGRDRRPHGEPGQVDRLEHDPHLGAGSMFPKTAPISVATTKGQWSIRQRHAAVRSR